MKAIIVFTCWMLLTVVSLTAQSNAKGVIFREDGSVQFSDETLHLFTDSAYRAEVFPVAYRIEEVPDLLDQQELLRALWILINVLPKDNQQTGMIAGILAQKGVRGQHYLEAFYTYVFADPEVIQFDGKTAFLQDPIVLEAKLESCKTLVVFTEKLVNSSVAGIDGISSPSK